MTLIKTMSKWVRNKMKKLPTHICCMNEVDELGRCKCITCGKSESKGQGSMRKSNGGGY